MTKRVGLVTVAIAVGGDYKFKWESYGNSYQSVGLDFLFFLF